MEESGRDRQDAEKRAEKCSQSIAEIAQNEKKVESSRRKLLRRRSSLEKKGKELKKELEKVMKKRSKLQNRKKEKEKTENSLKREKEKEEAKLNACKNELRSTMSPSMFEAYTRTHEVVEKYENELRGGVYGPLIDLIECEESYDAAVEASSNSKLFYWVVDTDETAEHLIDLLNKEKAGRITCIPLNQVQTPSRKYPSSADVVPLVNLIQFDEKYKKAFGQVFGGTVVIRDLQTGYDHCKAGFDCITLDGDKVNSRGVLEGGHNVGRYRRLKSMRTLKGTEETVSQLTERLEETEVETSQLKQQVTNIMSDLDAKQKEKNESREELDSITQKLDECEASLRDYGERRESSNVNLEKLRRTVEEFGGTIDALNEDMKAPLRNQLDEGEKKELENVSEELEDTKKQLAEAVKALGNLEREKDGIEIKLKRNLYLQKQETHIRLAHLNDLKDAQELDRRENELEELRSDHETLQKEVETMEKALDSTVKQLATLEKEVEALQNRAVEETTEVDEYFAKNVRSIGKKEALQEKINSLTKRIRELGAINQRQAAKYQKNSLGTLKKKLTQVMRDLKKFSNVNRKALDQFNQFTGQLGTLTGKHQRRTDDKEHIDQLITHMDAKKDAAISATFEAINEKFSDVFREIVPRGHAELVLIGSNESQNKKKRKKGGRRRRRGRRGEEMEVDESDEESSNSEEKDEETDLESALGVGIRVRFAGGDSEDWGDESGANLAQLSGGQQTVVALAFIFAIQRCDPSPFYVFDEIDAALDAQYRRAIATMLQSTDKTQFICTTFKPEFLHNADAYFKVRFRNKISTVKAVSEEEATSLLTEEPNQ